MRALVVEDDPTSAKLIDVALRNEGIICEPADTGEVRGRQNSTLAA